MTDNNEWLELIRSINLLTILKASLVLFVITLQILAIVWIIQHLGGSSTTTTTTTTVTTTAPTTTTTTP